MSITAPAQTIVPAVRALVAAIQASFAAADENMQVILGAQREVKEDDFVLVAAPTENGVGVNLTPQPSDQGHAQQWDLTIVCLLSTWAGDRNIDARFTRAQEMLDLVAVAVAENPDLDGTVSVADFGQQAQLTSHNDKDGVAVEIAFTVSCELY